MPAHGCASIVQAGVNIEPAIIEELMNSLILAFGE